MRRSVNVREVTVLNKNFGEEYLSCYFCHMNRIGIAGVGHLGKHHLRLLQDIPDLELAGCFDNDLAVMENMQDQGTRLYSSFEEMLAEVDVVDIVVPTHAHYDLATQALNKGKHVFLEKPIAETPE
ncbi:MAG: Gfo/Idh/MocA family oxidoreductase, partial [Calditrichota bacterium]